MVCNGHLGSEEIEEKNKRMEKDPFTHILLVFFFFFVGFWFLVFVISEGF